MISFGVVGDAAKAAAYYCDLANAAEYYSGGSERVPSRWLGTGAALQGLRGPVGHDALTDQLNGKVCDASGGERHLGIQREGRWQHRAGWDLTVSAPKSVSIEALVHDRRDVIEAHRKAVVVALSYMEQHAAQARIGGKTVKTGNLTAAAYDHVSSRSGDPQLHTHLLISNVTYGRDGVARSLSNEELLRSRRAADAVYHQTLSYQLQRLGYAVTHDRHGRVEIADYDRAQLLDMSTRTAEIEKALAARGLTTETASPQVKQIIKLDTRALKQLPETREAHMGRWSAQADALGITVARRDPTIASEARHVRGFAAAVEAVREALAHTSERESVVRARDLHCSVARFAEGRCSWQDVEHALAAVEADGTLVRGEGDRFTARAALESERAVADALQRGKGDHQAVMTEREFGYALARFEESKGFALSDDQRAAAKMILTAADRYQGVQGLAGTGKTTLLAFVKEAAESRGWRVIGHSNGSEQASVLEHESGIQSTTTARHLIDEQRVVEARQARSDRSPAVIKELRIQDEASQAGQRDFASVVETTAAAGARTVFLGDKRQHQSVEAGRAFERAQQHIPVATLGAASIRRQRTEHTKAAVADVLAGRYGSALRQGSLVEVNGAQSKLGLSASRDAKRTASRQDNAAVIQRLAADYAVLAPEDRARILVVTSTNNDRKALNEAIREQLKANGELVGGHRVAVLTKVDMTRAECKRAANFEIGQVVEVNANYKRLQIGRGSQWQIERIDQRSNTVHVRNTNGDQRTLHPSALKLRVFHAEQRELSAGEKIKWTQNHQLQGAAGSCSQGPRVRNGQSAHVEQIHDGGRLTVRLNDGTSMAIDPGYGIRAEHDYVVTSHAAQGRSPDRTWIHHNVEAGAHGAREGYVNFTRARDDMTMYTQNSDRAERQLGIELNKTAAHDIHLPDAQQPIRAREDAIRHDQHQNDFDNSPAWS